MRILVAGFQHETNTFAARPADWKAFEAGDFFPPFSRGAAMPDRVRTAGLPMSGFLEEAARAGWQVVPSVWAGASPSGPVTRDAFERIAGMVVGDLADALATGPIDGVYLDLHGAAVSEHLEAPETELLRRVRSAVGAEVPIVASLDSHANVDEAMLEQADHLVAYRTYPHVDMRETGAAAFRLLERRIAMGARQPFAVRRPPFLLPIVTQTTLGEPAASVYRLLAEQERRHGGSPSFATGFPAADVPQCGPTVWAYGADADAIVDEIHGRIVEARAEWRPQLLDADAAVREAVRLAEHAIGPIVIADVQDNPGAGADGSTTGLLRALMRADVGRRWPGRVAIGLLNDSVAATAAHRAGTGATIDVTVGAAVETWSGRSEAPVAARFRVRGLADGRAVLGGPMMTGAVVDAGPSACLETDGLLVGVSSARTQTLDRALLRMVGIIPEEMRIIVVKSAVHFRADFDPIATGVVLAKSPGPMAADPADLTWTRMPAGVSRRA